MVVSSRSIGSDRLGLRQAKIAENAKELEALQKGAAADGKAAAAKVDRLKNNAKKLRERKRQIELSLKMKEELKTVSLGTSKINYMDPRITVAWCKSFDVPVEKMFPRALLEKFGWAMEVEPEFRF